MKNLHAISGMSKEFQELPVLQGEFLPDLTALDRFREGIIRVENQNKSWWLPRFGLRESIRVEKELKEHYCRQYQSRFMGPFDQNLMQNIQAFDFAASDHVYAQYMIHLVRRINILKEAPYTSNIKRLREKPQPQYIPTRDDGPANHPEAMKLINNQNFYYLAWREDADQIRKETAGLEDAVRSLYGRRNGNLQWMLALTDQRSDLLPLTLNDFWGGDQQAARDIRIQPCFTRQGREVIEHFFSEFSQAYPDAPSLITNKNQFDQKYRTLCFEAWRYFADGFSRGWNA